ncbi:hypothetical protein [Deinococcus arenicola]|uniref:DUF1275 domain-containing protein n=1 Tax=Deinococcus arenicola TaxID=2994950 RepID=A0ABU4DRL4_9DEIO|nr:hypothetical protein [Deinococcus sp. ZS9-10]MDV6375077.1 hypothetical protein [Deinococcus sp. ZS9-10]
MNRPPAPQPALARPLDFSYPSNRIAAAGAVGALLLGRVVRGNWWQALGVGGAAFSAWAIARELDPDSPQTANAALPVAAAAALLGGPGNPLAAFAALSGLRMIAGTTGDRATPADQMGLLVQSALAAATGNRSAALLASAAPLLTPASRSLQPLLGVLMPRLWRDGATGLITAPAALLGLGAVALTPIFTAPEPVDSPCDRAPRTVKAEEVQRARQAAVISLALGLGGGVRELVPLAAAVVTVGLRRVRAKPVQPALKS